MMMTQPSEGPREYEDDEKVCTGRDVLTIHSSVEGGGEGPCSTQLSLLDDENVEADIMRCEVWMKGLSVRLMMLRCLDDVIDEVMTRTQRVLKKESSMGEAASPGLPDTDHARVEPHVDKDPGVRTVSGEKSVTKDASTVHKLQNLFGGAVSRSKQVRNNITPNKKCVRSRLNRCLVHRCQFVEVEQEKRILGRGEDGKICYKTSKERIWKCGTQLERGDLKPVSDSDLGGNLGGRKDAQNDDEHVDRKSQPSTASKIADNLMKNSMGRV